MPKHIPNIVFLSFIATCFIKSVNPESLSLDIPASKETNVLDNDAFVKYGDINALKEKVKEDLPYKKEEIAKYAKDKFSKETMIRNYLEEYDKGGKKNRILLIDVNYKNSSTGKIVYDLFNGIKKEGRQARVCYGRGPKVNEEDVYKFGIDIETYMHASLARLTGYNARYSYVSTKRLINYIEEFKPDLIHIHELHAYFVNIRQLLDYIKEKNIPVVWTFHCEYMYTGKCGHAYKCNNFIDGCGNCPSIKDYPKSIWFDKTREMLKEKKEAMDGLNVRIVTPSKWLANRVKQSFLKDREISVIHNGIDTDIFHFVDASDLRKELNIKDDYKIILSLAPDIMSERKGGKWIIELSKMMKDDKYVFVLVGQ